MLIHSDASPRLSAIPKRIAYTESGPTISAVLVPMVADSERECDCCNRVPLDGERVSGLFAAIDEGRAGEFSDTGFIACGRCVITRAAPRLLTLYAAGLLDEATECARASAQSIGAASRDDQTRWARHDQAVTNAGLAVRLLSALGGVVVTARPEHVRVLDA